ncbi:hypothetical protein [Xanthobacter sp. KR7-225]|uniref:hypothetical protein n=1 Tax=Xanthobacter sp. KR7-225 TaxID=3156613 RepID=UPI0032B3EE11
MRARGYTVIDRELAVGLRSIAVPLLNAHGDAVAARHLGLPALAGGAETLATRHLPARRRVQEEVRKILR